MKCLNSLLKINLSKLINQYLKLVNSCINELLPTTHEICKSFHKGFEVRLVFLDIVKVFDKV